jgi:hypothetical protein
MKLRYAAATLLMAAPAILFAFAVRPSFAFDASYHREPKDLPPQLASRLTEQLSDEAEPYLDHEDEKHTSGETYVDLQSKFEYLPSTGSDGRMVVSAKLGGAEYQPVKGAAGKGKATGKLKYLVFSYALDNGKWVEINKPRWETQDLGAAAGKKMTASAARTEKRKALARQAALKAAAEKAQQSVDQ